MRTLSARLLLAGGVAAFVGLAVLAVRWDDPGAPVAAVRAVSSSASPAPSTAAPPATPAVVTTVPSPTTTSAPTTGAHPKARSTTASTVATTAAPTIHPGALHRPKPGTYALRVTSGGTTTKGTLTVDAEQWQRRVVGDDRRTELLVWDRDGALLASSGEPGADGACDWDHEALEVPTDLAEGRTWSSRVTCHATISGRAVQLTRVETAAVRARARTKLDGGTVDTWVIDRRVVLSIEGPGLSTVTDATSTELFAPDLGLPVFTASRTKVPQPDGSVKTVEASEELLDRTPAPASP